jgi:tRNA (guanosine-2'-O-)-methyltransferase
MDEVDQLIERYGIPVILEAVAPMLSERRIETLERVLQARLQSVTVVLENLYDPHNGAAAVRSVEAFGLCDVHTVDGPGGAFRASAEVTIGSHKWIDLHSHQSAAECARSLRQSGFALLATIPGAELSLEEVSVETPVALWFGNEKDGLSPEARELCDAEVAIPMFGMSQSFNLSVSVALFCHRISTRRRAFLKAAGDLPEDRKEFLRARWRAQGIRGLRRIIERSVSNATR